MFSQLIESQPKKQKAGGGTVFSIVFHGALIAGAVAATAGAGIANEKAKAEKIQFVEVKKNEPPPPKPKEPPPPPPKDVVVAPPPPKGFQVVTAPINIPKVIPDIDLTKKATNEADFSGKGVAGGSANGVVGGIGPVNVDKTYYDYQVEKAAAQAPGSPTPSYPEVLRSSGVEGSVQAQFVVDTTGRAAEIKILSSTNDLFSAAVRSALPRMRFYPAEVGGRKVKQLVQQPFQFAITK